MHKNYLAGISVAAMLALGSTAAMATPIVTIGGVGVPVGSAPGGVYLSSAGGVTEKFRLIGLKDKDVSHLAVQSTGARDYLWATVAAEAGFA